MEKTVAKFGSFAEADKANKRYYLSLSPAQRMEIFLELLARYRDSIDDAPAGFERVYRIVKRHRR
jgi:hypothetical protein